MGDIEKVKKMLSLIPPDLDGARKELSEAGFSKEELAEIAIDAAYSCFDEYHDALNLEKTGITVDAMNSGYLIETLQILLDHGLDPNTVVDDENVMWLLQYADAPNIGPAALRLLLENGGDPNHVFPADAVETLFEYVTYKVSYDEYTHEFFHTVQFWLVLLAYGGHWRNGSIPITMLNGYTVEIFKDFESFDYTIEPLPQEPGKYGCWIMHIFRVDNDEEVARF